MNSRLFVILPCLTIPVLPTQARKNEKPNVVFIYADDLGRGMLSHYGQTLLSTPNIDRLFDEGTSFDYAYGCMYSAPSRASLITGYNDCRQGLWEINKAGRMVGIHTEDALAEVEQQIDAERLRMREGDLLLPQIFKEAGYVTAQIGKLEWGFNTTRQEMHEHGWDYFCGYMDHQHAHCYYPQYLIENDQLVNLHGNFREDEGRGQEVESPESYESRWDMTGKETYSADFLVERLLGFIRQNASTGQPFFLFHSTTLPHGPVAIPEVHPSVKSLGVLSEIEKEYASMVIRLDDHVGMILDELDRQGILENTIVIFSADNGHETYYASGNRCRKNKDTDGRPFDSWDYPYRSDLTGDLFNGNDGFSGKKWMNWEGSVRVPLTFMWKKHIRPGFVTDQVVANYDLLATFADMLHVGTGYPKDGASLLPVLTGKKKQLPGKRYVFINSREGPAVISSDHWKLRYNHRKKAYRLHYLPVDPQEEEMLNDQYPRIFKKMRDQLNFYIQ